MGLARVEFDIKGYAERRIRALRESILGTPILTFYLYEFAFSAYYFMRDGGTADMMTILPLTSSTASVVTVLYYSSIGLLLYKKLGWPSVFSLAVMAAIQEYIYNGLNLLLTPDFLPTVLGFHPRWPLYMGLIGALGIIAWFLQSRLLRPRYCLNWASLLFPAYLVYYGLTLAYVIRLTLPGWLNLFILTLFISYLKTVGLGNGVNSRLDLWREGKAPRRGGGEAEEASSHVEKEKLDSRLESTD